MKSDNSCARSLALVGVFALVGGLTTYCFSRPELYITPNQPTSPLESSFTVHSNAKEFWLVLGEISKVPSMPGIMVDVLYKVQMGEGDTMLRVNRSIKPVSDDTYDLEWSVLDSNEAPPRMLNSGWEKAKLIPYFGVPKIGRTQQPSELEAIMVWSGPRTDGLHFHAERHFLAVAPTLEELRQRYVISKLQPNYKWGDAITLMLGPQTRLLK